MTKPAPLGQYAYACLFAGPVAAILAPILFPVLSSMLGQNATPSVSSFEGYFVISGFALIIGIIGGLIIGFPSLVLLGAIDLNYPWLLAIVGAVASCVIFALGGPRPPQPPISEIWPAYVYVAVIGGSCGAVSSYRSLRDSWLPISRPPKEHV